MFLNQFELSVSVNGRAVKEYSHRGNTFIEGKEGSEFEIVVKNNSFDEVLAVVSVDGKSVMTGENCSIENSGGYVIPAMSHIKIPGWRLNNDSIAKFVYSNPQESYAAQTSEMPEEPLNLGVIGCAIFKRQPVCSFNRILRSNGTSISPKNIEPRGWDYPCSPPIWYSTSNLNHSINCNASADATANTNSVTLDSMTASSTSQIGTGFGREQEHAVMVTEFKRQATPEAIMTIYYDSRNGLQAKGVPLTPVVAIVPQAFPGSTNKGCKPPAGWKNR